MRNRIFAIILALTTIGIVGGTVAIPAAQAQVRVSVDLFYRDLSPYGRWVEHPRYGWVWYPITVSAQWRPYTEGHWVWTEEYGWYWVSDERFGWATYHYGRWGYDDQYGWIWVPGTEWGPSWVAFRHGDRAIGWAPLPPDTLDMRDPRGGGVYIDLDQSYYQPRWVFVSVQFFTAPRVYSYVVPRSQNITYIRQTTNVTNYVTVNNITVNRSIDPRRIEGAVGHRIEPVRVNQVNSVAGVTGGGGGGKGGKGGTINVFNPVVEKSDTVAPPPAARAKPTDKPKVTIQKDFVSPTESRKIDGKGPAGTTTPTVTAPTGTVTPTPPGGPGKTGGQGQGGQGGGQGKPGTTTAPTGPTVVTPMPAPTPTPSPTPGDTGKPGARGRAPTTGPAVVTPTPVPTPTPSPAPGATGGQGKPDDTGKPGARGRAPTTGPAVVTPTPVPTPSPTPTPGGQGQGQGQGKPGTRGTAPTGPAVVTPAPTPTPGPAPSGQGGGQGQGGQGKGKPDGKSDQTDCGKPGQPACR